MTQNVKLDSDMAYVETDDKGQRYLMIAIPFPDEATGWIPDKGDGVERVTAIDAANGDIQFKGMVAKGTLTPIGGLDDETAKLTVKLTVDPFVARDDLGLTILLPDTARGERAATSTRRSLPVDQLTTKAVDKSRRNGPVHTRKAGTPAPKR